MHYLIIIAIIAIIVIIQFRLFFDTRIKINDFNSVFPKGNDQYNLSSGKDAEYNLKVKEINDANFEKTVDLCKRYKLNSEKYIYTQKDEEGVEKVYIGKSVKSDLIAQVPLFTGIVVTHNNNTLKTIVNSINDYLKNNKTVSDFHLMKDIVDRNCDAKEDEIATQIPIPLYMGLVGTMAGILIGILYLWISGGIGLLLSVGGGNGADGIEALLGGVALAMISSILGIVLTTLGSIKFKTAKATLESRKHVFLSWIQAKLLPTLSDNVVGAIREMTGKLEHFNKEFAQNTGNLGSALDKVNQSYKMQVQLLDTVRQIADKDVTQKNLELYHALQNSSGEIGKLAEYLNNCNLYLANVQALNKKLDDYEKRTQFIENASRFYSKHENWLAENYDEANRKLKEVVGRYNSTIEETFKTVKSDIESKRQELGTFLNNQNTALKSSAGDLDRIVKALSELGEVQKSVKAFESATKEQNKRIDRLAEHIEKLANAKSLGGIAPLPTKTPLLQISLIGVIALSCMILAAQSFIKSEPDKEINQSQPVVQKIAIPAEKDTVVTMDSTEVVKKKNY